MAGYLGSVNLRSVTRVAERNLSVNGINNIFNQNIPSEMTGSSVWTIQFSFQDSGSIEVITTDKHTGNVITEILNSDVYENQDYLYTFITSENESLNFKYSVATTCNRFMLMESGGIY